MSGFSRDYPTTLKEALQEAQRTLSRSSRLLARGTVDTEAEQLVQAAFKKATGRALGRAELFVRASDPFPPAAAESLLVMSSKRADGALLQHLIGYQQFLAHEYAVSPDVLVPRPETELLVERAVARLKEGVRPRVGLEIGVGSGVISIELLAAFPGLRMVASELSEGARAIALANAEAVLGSRERLELQAALEPEEVLEPFIRHGLAELPDFLISNPPYLASEDETEEEVWQNEPAEALFAPEEDPLHFYRKIAEGARTVLRPGAFVFLELPHERAFDILELFTSSGFRAEIFKDLAGRERILEASVLL